MFAKGKVRVKNYFLALVVLCVSGCGGQFAEQVKHAQVQIDEAKAVAKAAIAHAEQLRAEKDRLCAEALDIMRGVEAVAPYACARAVETPGVPEIVSLKCAQQDRLTSAVLNMTAACGLRL